MFVFLDDVQFPRRGYVHRNRFLDSRDVPQWLTLPVQKAPRETSIASLQFQENVREKMLDRCRSFPVFEDLAPEMDTSLAQLHLTVTEYLIELLLVVVQLLGLRCETVRSSELALDSTLAGQEKILAIIKALDGSCYINSPGGKSLYDHEQFKRNNVELRFLSLFEGSGLSILEDFHEKGVQAISRSVLDQVVYQPQSSQEL